jgi:hypothetical protein
MVSLPTGLDDARNFTFESQLTKTDPAQTEFAEVAMRAATDTATIVGSHLELRCSLLFSDQGFFSHNSLAPIPAYV